MWLVMALYIHNLNLMLFTSHGNLQLVTLVSLVLFSVEAKGHMLG